MFLTDKKGVRVFSRFEVSHTSFRGGGIPHFFKCKSVENIGGAHPDVKLKTAYNTFDSNFDSFMPSTVFSYRVCEVYFQSRSEIAHFRDAQLFKN